MTDNAEQNLQNWLRLHQLPSHFPSLDRRDLPTGYVTPPPFLRNNGSELRQILDQVLGSFRSMVVFPPGQGASTLMDVLIARLRSADIRSFDLIVRLDVAELAQADDLGETWQAAVRRNVFDQLVRYRWIGSLMGTRKQKLMVLFDTVSDRTLLDLEYGLYNGDQGTQARVQDIADRYDGQLATLIHTLYNDLGISVTLAFDFPWQAKEDAVYEVFREIKWFDETEKDASFPPAALRETYFLTRQQANIATSVWSVNFHEFEVRPYSMAETFQILSHHFRPVMAGQSYPLATALPDGFIERVWKPGKPLVDMSQDLKHQILTALAVDPDRMPYTLEPVRNP
jgi:hypothetical protein